MEEKFFNAHRSGKPAENAIIAFLKEQNDRLGFVQKTIQQVGFPRWNKTMEILR